MKTPGLIGMSLYRANLILLKMKRSNSIERDIVNVVNIIPPGKKSIWYVNDAATALQAYRCLEKLEFKKSRVFFAALSADFKGETIDSFRNGEIEILIATIAFGMGCHVPDVEFIVHFFMPKELVDYIQMIGRGGRNGARANCLLLIATRVKRPLIAGSSDNAVRRHRTVKRSDAAAAYYHDNGVCLHRRLLEAAGEDFELYPFHNCVDKCTVCLKLGISTGLTAVRGLSMPPKLSRAKVPMEMSFEQLQQVRDAVATFHGVDQFLVADDGLLAALFTNPHGLLQKLIHPTFRHQFRHRLQDYELGGEELFDEAAVDEDDGEDEEEEEGEELDSDEPELL